MERKKHFRIALIILTCLLLFGHSFISAQTGNIKAKATIIVDLTQILNLENAPGSAGDVYKIYGKDITDIIADLNNKLGASYRNVKINEAAVLDDTQDPELINNSRALFLSELKNQYKNARDSRWLSKINYIIDVYIFSQDQKATIKIEEKPRRTQIAQDITTLAQLFAPLAAPGDPIRIKISNKNYRLSQKHGTVIISYSLTGANDKREDQIEIITGPAEHIFLSADLIIAKLNNASFTRLPDGNFGTNPVATSAAKEFYIGFNWMLGDLLAEKQQLIKNIFFKGMIKFSHKPLESVGLGIGYRLPNSRVLGFNASFLSIFVASTWSKQDTFDPLVRLTKQQFQFGLGFNLDRALNWIR